jgi:hypothetical protein
MDPNFEKLLQDWPLCVIRDIDIATVISDNAPRRYAAVNRALKKGILVRLRRGVYLTGKRFRKVSPSNFQIAHTIYGPSYISFESALYYHQWIPEAVYTTTCATAKRSREFETPLGLFRYTHVPNHLCYLGIQRVGNNDDGFFMADPWKALADHYYAYNRNWNRPEDLYSDMRIEMEDMLGGDLTTLQLLAKHYQSDRVRKFLTKILRSLTDGNKNY